MGETSQLMKCPDGCHDSPAEPIRGVRKEFQYTDGTSGKNNYCQHCGAGLIEVPDR